MANLQVSPEELKEMHALSDSNNRQGKKDWWNKIRNRYGLDEGDKYKVGLTSGTIRNKYTGEPIWTSEPSRLYQPEKTVEETDAYGFLSSGVLHIFTGPDALTDAFQDPHRDFDTLIFRTIIS